MKEIIAYEMIYNKALKYQNDIICVPFQKEYWNEYQKIYNECFYKMRKALEVEPINFYDDYSQIKDKIKDIFLYLQNGIIIGAVSCYENEIDDLIVEKSFQRQGIGQKLLFWGINHIKEQGYEEIILHVAEWNQNAVKLYLKNGFRIKKRERVR
ncbi:MAG: GNAT family N-acetyltransferase [Lachnospiraceae bacterium]|jgi:ribosomal protein S18 acetylase RimI-like enzyme|nr:GNAT family N-acetyltransferase [Lachnospiraceae bacterium]MCI9399145.1 GNAT family N-acetyltransferase [Lachnospiraceae bacterium]MCX4377825.1 GNAT family N-acetyltransferase [Lachnospiraceae bacterium]